VTDREGSLFSFENCEKSCLQRHNAAFNGALTDASIKTCSSEYPIGAADLEWT